jgi:hypothetical protein
MQAITTPEPIARAALLAREPVPSEAPALHADQVTVSLEAVAGDVAIEWTQTGVTGRYDYVALYGEKPDPEDPTNYLRRQWEYTSDNESPFISGKAADGTTPYFAAYCAWDYGQNRYVIVASVGPQTVG